MPSLPLLDVDSLLEPIPGDQAEGGPVPFEVREQLEKMRREEDPDDYAPDDPRRPEKFAQADWAGIVRLAQKVLKENSKELQTAARLVEALTKQSGFGGLRDGLNLLRRLIEECWDRLYPPIEEDGDIDVRAAALVWLDDPDHGARFPTTLHLVPLVASDSQTYSWQDWRTSQDGRPGAGREDFDKAIRLTPYEQCQTQVEDLTQAQVELNLLAKAVNDRMGQNGPGLINLRQALEGCLTLAQQIMQRRGPAPQADESTSETAAAAAAPAGNGRAGVARQAATREDAYRQLAQVAAVLQQLEPHSPIPYLVQRAVELGSLPFPELIKALIRDSNVLTELNRELGIKEGNQASS